MSKGSRQRPTDTEKYNVNWEKIFGIKEPKQEKQPKEPENKKTK